MTGVALVTARPTKEKAAMKNGSPSAWPALQQVSGFRSRFQHQVEYQVQTRQMREIYMASTSAGGGGRGAWLECEKAHQESGLSVTWRICSCRLLSQGPWEGQHASGLTCALRHQAERGKQTTGAGSSWWAPTW